MEQTPSSMIIHHSPDPRNLSIRPPHPASIYYPYYIQPQRSDFNFCFLGSATFQCVQIAAVWWSVTRRFAPRPICSTREFTAALAKDRSFSFDVFYSSLVTTSQLCNLGWPAPICAAQNQLWILPSKAQWLFDWAFGQWKLPAAEINAIIQHYPNPKQRRCECSEHPLESVFGVLRSSKGKVGTAHIAATRISWTRYEPVPLVPSRQPTKEGKKNYLVLIWLPSLPRPANLTCTRKSARSCAVQGRQLACELPPRAPNFSRTKGKEARRPFNSLRNSCFTVQFPRSGVSPPCNWLPRLFSGEATYLAILGQKTSEMLHLTCTMQTGTVKFGLQQNFWQKKITMTPKFYRCRSHTSTLTICHSIPRLPTDTAYKK